MVPRAASSVRLTQWLWVCSGRCQLDMAAYTEIVDGRRLDYLYPINALRNRALMLAETEVSWLLISLFECP